MKRYDPDLKKEVDVAIPAVDAFVADIVAVYRKHGLSISQQDGHGAFIIERLSEENIGWLESADVDLRKGP